MNIWVVLWVLLSVGLMGFLLWTYSILIQQKQTWKQYASKHKLRYKAGKFSESPEIAGTMPYNGTNYTINFFTGQHMSEDVRNARKLTAIEIRISDPPPYEGVVASGGMVDFSKNLEFSEEVRPQHPKWNKTYIAISDAKHVQDAYLTSTRLDALTDLMEIKNGWVILVFKNDINVLRFDTPDALKSINDLDSIVQKMLAAANLLQVDETEKRTLSGLQAQKPKKQVSIDVSEDKLYTGDLTLEDDEE